MSQVEAWRMQSSFRKQIEVYEFFCLAPVQSVVRWMQLKIAKSIKRLDLIKFLSTSSLPLLDSHSHHTATLTAQCVLPHCALPFHTRLDVESSL